MSCVVAAGDNAKSLTPQLIVLNDEEEAAPAEAEAAPGARRKKEKPIPKWGDNPTVQVGPYCHTH